MDPSGTWCNDTYSNSGAEILIYCHYFYYLLVSLVSKHQLAVLLVLSKLGCAGVGLRTIFISRANVTQYPTFFSAP